MPSADSQILADAIARNSAVVLSLPSAGMLRHHKSRFLADDLSAGGFWIESANGDDALLDELIVQGQAAGLSFKAGTQKVVFASRLLRRQHDFHINAQTTINALLVASPKEVKAVQRRGNYRVRIPSDGELRVRMWRIGALAYLADRPMAAQELHVRVRDLSLGGIGVTILARSSEPTRVTAEDRLRINLEYKNISLLLEGRMRHPSLIASATPTAAGIQFKALEANLQDRQSLAHLTRIVGELQREEVRRMRMGTIAAA